MFIVENGYSQNPLVNSKYATPVQDFISSKKENFKLTSNDVSDLYVNKEIFTEKNKTTQIYVNQRYQGIAIHNAISTISIKDNKGVYYANRFVNNISKKINTTTPLINSEQAINKAVAHFNLGSIKELQFIETIDKKDIYSKSNISQENIPVELVYFQIPEGSLKLSWNLSIYTLDSKHWWSVRVDASSGAILNVNDWVVSCNFGGNHTEHGILKKASLENKESFTLFKNVALVADGSQYNVYPLPTESPNHGGRQLLSEPSDDTASPFGWHDDDGIAGAEYTITQGNNVIAQLDDDGNNGTGYSPDGGASLNFNFSLDLIQQPSGYKDVAITNLFYMNNMMHDIWYQYGFDIRSGAFQKNHYARINAAGVGDPVLADAQDGSGFDNANFATPPDGSSPRMQMFLWNTPGGEPLIINGGALAGSYVGFPAGFGNELPIIPLTADLALIVDNDDGGTSADPNDGCDTVTNVASLIGKIVVIRRGDCEFGVKVLSAENNGAVAVIMVNNVATDPISMGAGAVGDTVTIPSIMVSQADGEAIIAALLASETINASLTLPDRLDGDFDNGVIAHEYTHGISTRLTGGAANADCLFNNEQMGEGWSDWVTFMLTMKSSDVSTTGRGIGTFVSSEAVDGPGIRPSKYSADFAENSFTYGATNDDTLLGTDVDGNPVLWNEIVHNIGFVWATMLWDLSWAYVDKYGFDPNFYTGSGGNNKVMQLVIDGMKLQPCSPGFVDGRDAILAADITSTGGEDQCMIWEVFARRGLGFGAAQGDAIIMTDQTESFAMPTEGDLVAPLTLANCTTLSSKAFNSQDYKIYPNPVNSVLTINTNKSLGDVTITLVDLNGRLVLSKKATLLGEISLNISALQSGLYILNIKGEFINTNEKIIKN
jgi:extracellular elastinolytic metalloproteinase